MKITAATVPVRIQNQLKPLEIGQPVKLELNNDLDSKALDQAIKDVSVSLSKQAQTPSTPQPNFVVFSGDKQGLIFPESEKTERMQAVVSRLSESQSKSLIDNGFLDNDDFLQLAQALDDSELANLSDALHALQTPPQINQYSAFTHNGFRESRNFISNLAAMDEAQRTQVLQKAAELSQQVAPSEANTYQADGLFKQGSRSANDIHNFIGTVNRFGAGEELDGFLNVLEQFDPAQQSDLLQVFTTKAKLGFELAENLQQFKPETQSQVLSYMAELSRSLSPFQFTSDIQSDPKSLESAGALINYDDYSRDTVENMMSNVNALMQDYRFDDQQLSDMVSAVQDLERADQRAYLEITHQGLDKLVGGSKEQPQRLDKHNAKALAAIESLRSSATARELVYRSRMGEENIGSEGQRFFDFKNKANSHNDQRQTIAVLATNALLNNDDAQSSLKLATKLSGLEASQRDALVDDLAKATGGFRTLLDHGQISEADQYQRFEQQSNALIASSDVEALLAVEQQIDAVQRPDFWQAADLLERDVDSLVQTLEGLNSEGQAAIVATIATVAELTEQGELEEDDAREQASELLSAIKE